jgi:hypothetical protein
MEAEEAEDKERVLALSGGESNVEDKVESFTRAVAAILLPMISSLASLQEEDLAAASETAGEAV